MSFKFNINDIAQYNNIAIFIVFIFGMIYYINSYNLHEPMENSNLKDKKKLSLRIEECKKEVKKWLFFGCKGVSMAKLHIKKCDDAKVMLFKAKLAFQRFEEKLELAELELNKSNEKYLLIRSSVIKAGLRKN